MRVCGHVSHWRGGVTPFPACDLAVGVIGRSGGHSGMNPSFLDRPSRDQADACVQQAAIHGVESQLPLNSSSARREWQNGVIHGFGQVRPVVLGGNTSLRRLAMRRAEWGGVCVAAW